MISPPSIFMPKSTCGWRYVIRKTIKKTELLYMDELNINLAQSINSYCVIRCPHTFSNKDTTMLVKQGKAGTRGFKATRGAAKICRSTNWEEEWLSNHFGDGKNSPQIQIFFLLDLLTWILICNEKSLNINTILGFPAHLIAVSMTISFSLVSCTLIPTTLDSFKLSSKTYTTCWTPMS